MAELFKKVLFGYNTQEVDKKMLILEQEFEKVYEEYVIELNTFRSQTIELENKISRLKDEMKIYNDFNEKLSSILCNAYIKSSEMIYNSKANLNEKISEKNSELVSLENKNLDIRNSVNKLLFKLENIVHEL